MQEKSVGAWRNKKKKKKKKKKRKEKREREESGWSNAKLVWFAKRKKFNRPSLSILNRINHSTVNYSYNCESTSSDPSHSSHSEISFISRHWSRLSKWFLLSNVQIKYLGQQNLWEQDRLINSSISTWHLLSQFPKKYSLKRTVSWSSNRRRSFFIVEIPHTFFESNREHERNVNEFLQQRLRR